jgi:hypothetical protein
VSLSIHNRQRNHPFLTRPSIRMPLAKANHSLSRPSIRMPLAEANHSLSRPSVWMPLAEANHSFVPAIRLDAISRS